MTRSIILLYIYFFLAVKINARGLESRLVGGIPAKIENKLTAAYYSRALTKQENNANAFRVLTAPPVPCLKRTAQPEKEPKRSKEVGTF